MKQDDPAPKHLQGPPPDSAPMHERIRRRREERGIPAYVLAERLAISPSYISLIESGKKVPGEEIARRIAEALDDDVEIYVAWAHSAGIQDIDGYTTRLMRLRRYSADPALRRQLGSGADIEEQEVAMAAPMAASRSIIPQLLGARAAPIRDLAEVPLLEDGADPAASGKERTVAGPPLRLDARLFDEADLDRLFAYRATPAMAARAGEAVRPGDWVILSSRIDTKALHGVFAVRVKGRIALSRVLLKGSELLLLPPPGTSDFETIELKSGEDLRRVLAGRVVRTLRGVEG